MQDSTSRGTNKKKKSTNELTHVHVVPVNDNAVTRQKTEAEKE